MPIKKKKFKWEAGAEINPDDYDPLGNVKEVGFSKVADGIYADPTQRKKTRSQKWQKGQATIKPSTIVVEESESGLSKEYTPSEASHVIHKDSKGIKGILRFGKSQDQDKKKK